MTFSPSTEGQLALNNRVNRENYPPEAGTWEAALLVPQGFQILDPEEVATKTVQELCNNPYVIRFDLPTNGRVYFAGYDEALWQRLLGEGKTVRGLWEMFEGLRRRLIDLGLPAGISVYRWTIGDLWGHLAALETFPGSVVTRREPGQEEYRP